MGRKIKIVDNTLSMEEKVLGVNLNISEKIIIAKRLELLNIDVIEVGRPIVSNEEFRAVYNISNIVKNITVSALCKADPKEINVACDAIRDADKGRIHTFISTSPMRMRYKLNMDGDQVLERAIEAVKYSKKFFEDVEFTAEDACRSDKDFLCRVFENVIKAGATILNIPDTIGYITPSEYIDIIKYIIMNTKGIENVDISVQCHNDLGIAVANSLAGITAGANEVICSINGLGERAGNTALEEIVMAIEARKKFFKIETGINIKNLWNVSKLVSSITGALTEPNKSIMGENALIYKDRLYEDRILKENSDYEIITSESIGKVNNNIIKLDKYFNRQAFDNYLIQNSMIIPKEALERAYDKFKAIYNKNDEITHKEMEAIVNSSSNGIKNIYKLRSYQVYSGNNLIYTTTIEIDNRGMIIKDSAVGEGTLSSVFNALERVIGKKFKLKDYYIKSICCEKNFLSEAIIKIEEEGKIFVGSALSKDIIEASIDAYINAVNKMIEQLS